MRLVVGLGNPTPRYQFTRHNLGFLVLEHFLAQRRKQATKRIENALCCQLEVGQDQCWFIKPQLYMNRSGEVVAPFAQMHGISPHETLVVHDEVDLEPGRIKLKFDGGAGGHNGLESIFVQWQHRDFFRLRIGVGKDLGRDTTDHLLEALHEKDLHPLVIGGAKALETVLTLGPQQAMNIINSPKKNLPID